MHKNEAAVFKSIIYFKQSVHLSTCLFSFMVFIYRGLACATTIYEYERQSQTI